MTVNNDLYFIYGDLFKEKVIISSTTVKLCGIGESQAETEILDMIAEQTNPTIAPYAKTGEVHLRVTAKADNEEEAHIMMRPVIEELQKCLHIR